MKSEDLYTKAHRLSKTITEEENVGKMKDVWMQRELDEVEANHQAQEKKNMGKMSEIHAMIQEVDTLKEKLGHVDPDSMAMNKIKDILSGVEWEPSTLEEIAEVVINTGRIIESWKEGTDAD